MLTSRWTARWRALNQRPRAKIFAVDLEKIEQEVDQPSGIAAVRRSLEHAEGGDAVGAQPAQLAIKISLPGAERGGTKIIHSGQWPTPSVSQPRRSRNRFMHTLLCRRLAASKRS